MLEAVWKKGIPSILLMGMQIGAATMENSMGFLKKKTKNKATIWPSNSTPTHVSGKNENSNFKRYMYLSVHRSTICQR